jgi:hypothetical protein
VLSVEASDDRGTQVARVALSVLIGLLALVAGGTAVLAVVFSTPLTEHVNPVAEAYVLALGGGLVCAAIALVLLLHTLPGYVCRRRPGFEVFWQAVVMAGAWLVAAMGTLGLGAS